jgi:hypothetical protein
LQGASAGHMIFLFLGKDWSQVYFEISVVLWVCTGYAYYINSKLPEDDPNKKDFHPIAILLAPVTLPLLFFGMISLFILKAIAYSIFLFLFTLALVIIRKPFILVWLDKIAKKIGNILLEVNTYLIRLFLNPGSLQHV